VAKKKSETHANEKQTEAELNSASPVGEILSAGDPKTMADGPLAKLVIVGVKRVKELTPYIAELRRRFFELKGNQTIAGYKLWSEFCKNELHVSDRWARQLIEDSGEENPAAIFANTGTAAAVSSQETQAAHAGHEMADYTATVTKPDKPAVAEVQASTQEVTASQETNTAAAAQETQAQEPEAPLTPEAALAALADDGDWNVGLKIKGYDLALLHATILRTDHGRIKQDGFDQTNMTTVRKYVYTIVSNLLLAFEYKGDETFTTAVEPPNKDYLMYEIFVRNDHENMKAAKAHTERRKLLAAEELEKTTADAAAKAVETNDKNEAAAKKPKTKGASAGA
jgi:hypothetical protein